MRAPDAFETWAAIARTLAPTRPPSRGDPAAAAEGQALRVAEAVAAGAAGVITELRLEPGGTRTGIPVAITGTARYQVSRRLSDPIDPRLTLEVHDADASLLRARSTPVLDRGGVRELRVTPTDSGTVQLASALAAPRESGLAECGGAILISGRGWPAGGAAAARDRHRIGGARRGCRGPDRDGQAARRRRGRARTGSHRGGRGGKIMKRMRGSVLVAAVATIAAAAPPSAIAAIFQSLRSVGALAAAVDVR
ncbi:MAG TPA: hypothetical protein VF188_02890 [Longimicrobiales bacterium]